LCLDLFDYQMENNPIYSGWVRFLKKDKPESYHQIPFLPISFFKSKQVYASGSEPEVIFGSSTTTGGKPSLHRVSCAQLYEMSFEKSFRLFYGDHTDTIILALLPGYMDRPNASLIYMMERLIGMTGNPESGLFSDHKSISPVLKKADLTGKRVLLIGVSFALLELAKRSPMKLHNTTVMETGGMKGRGKELTRAQLHHVLKDAFGVSHIHSEYGMTELLSQAYAHADGLFQTPPWMQVSIRQTSDPLNTEKTGKTGGINVIDLANKFSCPFIATDDLGRIHADGSFEVLGRFDNSEVRGCNLMMF